MFQDLVAQSISEFHDQRLQDSAWPKKVNKPHNNGAWQWVEINHRFNCLLWAEEDLARRVDVADTEIAANKRAIDRYNRGSPLSAAEQLLRTAPLAAAAVFWAALTTGAGLPIGPAQPAAAHSVPAR